MTKERLLRVMLLAGSVISMALGLASQSQAQNIMRVRIDTVTAEPGDTATVNVYYAFTATHGHDIQDFRVRMQYDSSLIHEYRYLMGGTASEAFYDTTGSRIGILALGMQELDLANPVLIRMQFVVDSSLTDTAWIHWDSILKYPGLMFEEPQDSVDSVVLTDGWIKLPAVPGAISISTPQLAVDTGILDTLPVTISNVLAAQISSAMLRMVIDSSTISVLDVRSAEGANAQVESWIRTGDTLLVRLSAQAGLDKFITGGGAVAKILFSAHSADTVSDTPELHFEPLRERARFSGAAESSAGVIRITPGASLEVVSEPRETEQADLEIYPNPASNEVTIRSAGRASGPVALEVFDALGRTCWKGTVLNGDWMIPAALAPGAYTVVAEVNGRFYRSKLALEPH